MINNTNDITSYTPNHKMYLPSELVNSNYYYRINTNYILVITNQNCTGSGTSRRCSCIAYFFDQDIIGNSYQCSASISTDANNYTTYNSFTSDINYNKIARNNFFQEKSIIFFMFIIGLLLFISLRKGYRYK